MHKRRRRRTSTPLDRRWPVSAMHALGYPIFTSPQHWREEKVGDIRPPMPREAGAVLAGSSPTWPGLRFARCPSRHYGIVAVSSIHPSNREDPAERE